MKYKSLYIPLTAALVAGIVSVSAQTADENAALFQGVTIAPSLKPRFTHGNPLMTQAFHADPYAITYNDTMYVFGSDDTPRVSNGNILENNYSGIRNVALVSSGDLVNWTHHPRIRAASLSNRAAGLSWAPAVAYKRINGQMKFFLYISDGIEGIAVLSADHPTGPYTSARNGKLIDRNTPLCSSTEVLWLFDPGVLVDDDGRAYIYFGGGIFDEGTGESNHTSQHPNPGTMRVAELGADMVSIVPGSVKKFDVPFVFEAAQINKIGGVYYFTYCANFQVLHYSRASQAATRFPAAVAIANNGAIAYMTSNSPTEGFTLAANPTILRNPSDMFTGTALGNNHHSIVEFKGGYYIVYHSLLLRNYLNHPSTANGMGGYRSTHIDPITINTATRTISRVTGSTSGAPQVGRYNPYTLTNAATMANMAGITTTTYRRAGMSDSLMRVSDIHTGDWVALRGVDFGSQGAARFTCRVTPHTGSGARAIQIRAGTPGSDLPAASTAIGYVRIVPGQSEYTVDLLETVTGVKDVAFVFYGEGWHFEEWSFAEKGETSVRARSAGATVPGRPSVSIKGRTLDVSSPNNEALMISVIDVRGKVRARFDVNGNGKLSLAKIPAGRYFVDVRGAGVRQTLPVVIR